MWQNYKKMRVKQNFIHFIFAERQQHYKYLLLMLGKRFFIGKEDGQFTMHYESSIFNFQSKKWADRIRTSPFFIEN